MYISVFDIFKIGVGPSSSHTVGPMKAGFAFVGELEREGLFDDVASVQADLYGSLSMTGRGHGTDKAVIMGLSGCLPDTVEITSIPTTVDTARTQGVLMLGGVKEVAFPKKDGVRFNFKRLPLHENGMSISAYDASGALLLKKTYYSVGGGFIVDEEHFGMQAPEDDTEVPYPFDSAQELLTYTKRGHMSLVDIAWANELALHSEEEIRGYLARVWDVMREGIEHGETTSGNLPGRLMVPRRAAELYQKLMKTDPDATDPHAIMDWTNMYALAINEENAAGGRVVTAPTNGACGIVPAVLAYYNKMVKPVTEKEYIPYFLVAAMVGALYKMNASISGAEVGCQGEVGVACSMAAAGLAQLSGASPERVAAAAEIGMEHNLGLTCDPVLGQVQVPCIERNAMASVKAIDAVRLSLTRDTEPVVSLDQVIATMYQTGKDMMAKYRETAQGGLAVALYPKTAPCD